MTEPETTRTTEITAETADKAMAAERAHAEKVRALAEPPEPTTKTVATEAPRTAGAGFGALLAGGVIAALIGAGATVWALPRVPQLAALLPQPAAVDDSTADKIDAQAKQIAALDARIATLQSAPPAAADDQYGLRAALDETTAQLRNLDGRMKAVEDRIAAQGTASTTETADTSGLQAQIDALKAQIGAVSPEAISAQVNAAASQAETRLKQGEAQSAELRAQAEAAVKRTIQQSAVARLSAAYDAGAPLGPAIADAQAAGLSVPAAISATVPTLATLQMSFPAAARDALAAARKAGAREGGIGERAIAFLMTQVGARSVSPRDGADADAVLSRAGAAVEAGDIARATAELDTLPEAGKQAISGWMALAQARLAAGKALGDLAASVR